MITARFTVIASLAFDDKWMRYLGIKSGGHGELVETNLTIFLTDWWLPIQLEVVRTRLSEPLIAAYPNGGAL